MREQKAFCIESLYKEGVREIEQNTARAIIAIYQANCVYSDPLCYMTCKRTCAKRLEEIRERFGIKP